MRLLGASLAGLTDLPKSPSERVRKPRPYVVGSVLGVLGLAFVGGAIATKARRQATTPVAGLTQASSVAQSESAELLPEPEPTSVPRARLELAPLSAELRKKGYSECNPPDPLGWGPYSPSVRCGMGHIALPQRGGHTPDYGYDVVVHFHGAPPLRKYLVQVARGVVYVGVDLGDGSGKYSDAFELRESFPELRRAIEAALRRKSGQSHAHIRYLALSAWSAGYGAVNEILKHGDQHIDAVVLLDGLHAGWDPARNRNGTVKGLSGAAIAPTIDFARRAMHGEKIFVFTHSYVDPVDYPSTSLTAKLLLNELGVTRQAVDIPTGLLTQDSAVDQAGLHVWSYRGHDELAHCAHLSLVGRVLPLLEEVWDTPAMERAVPNAVGLTTGSGALR
jgi:hypothetical protein